MLAHLTISTPHGSLIFLLNSISSSISILLFLAHCSFLRIIHDSWMKVNYLFIENGIKGTTIESLYIWKLCTISIFHLILTCLFNWNKLIVTSTSVSMPLDFIYQLIVVNWCRGNLLTICCDRIILRHFQQYFSYIVQWWSCLLWRKSSTRPASHKSLTNIITQGCIEHTSLWAGIKLITLWYILIAQVSRCIA